MSRAKIRVTLRTLLIATMTILVSFLVGSPADASWQQVNCLTGYPIETIRPTQYHRFGGYHTPKRYVGLRVWSHKHRNRHLLRRHCVTHAHKKTCWALFDDSGFSGGGGGVFSGGGGGSSGGLASGFGSGGVGGFGGGGGGLNYPLTNQQQLSPAISSEISPSSIFLAPILAQNPSIPLDQLDPSWPKDPLTPEFRTAVPEPSTWLMMILGFIGLGFMCELKRKKIQHI